MLAMNHARACATEDTVNDNHHEQTRVTLAVLENHTGATEPGAPRRMRSRRVLRWVAAALGLSILTITPELLSQAVPGLITFTAGTPATAADVNANFALLASEVGAVKASVVPIAARWHSSNGKVSVENPGTTGQTVGSEPTSMKLGAKYFIEFDTQEFNVGSGLALQADGATFKATVAGYYAVSCGVYLGSNTATSYAGASFSITHNGQDRAISSGNQLTNASTVIALNVGDIVACNLSQWTAFDDLYVVSNETWEEPVTFFAAARIAPLTPP